MYCWMRLFDYAVCDAFRLCFWWCFVLMKLSHDALLMVFFCLWCFLIVFFWYFCLDDVFWWYFVWWCFLCSDEAFGICSSDDVFFIRIFDNVLLIMFLRWCFYYAVLFDTFLSKMFGSWCFLMMRFLWCCLVMALMMCVDDVVWW